MKWNDDVAAGDASVALLQRRARRLSNEGPNARQDRALATVDKVRPDRGRQNPAGGGGVEAFGETGELDASFIESFELGNQVFERAAESAQTPHHQGIALAEVLQARVELRTAGCLARDRTRVRLFAICRL